MSRRSATEICSDMRPVNRLALSGRYKGEVDFTGYHAPLHRQEGPHPLRERYKRPKVIGRLSVIGPIDRFAINVPKRRVSAKCVCGWYEVFSSSEIKQMELGRIKALCSRCDYAHKTVSADKSYTITSADAAYIKRRLSGDTSVTAKNIIKKLTPNPANG